MMFALIVALVALVSAQAFSPARLARSTGMKVGKISKIFMDLRKMSN
jgi:hypothetical protein